MAHPAGEKHALEHAWTMRHTHADRTVTLGRFDSVEDFWSLFNHLIAPSKLSEASMSAFRDPLEPSPGHAGNAGGGRLVLALARADEHLDRCWLNLLLAAVGESLDDELGDHVCGLLVSVRAGRPAHLSLWLADAEDAEAIGEIRCRMRASLGLDERARLPFRPHATAGAGERSTRATS